MVLAVTAVTAVTAVPLIALGVVFQMITARLFELPTLLIGCEWFALGAVMVSRRGIAPRVPATHLSRRWP